MAAVPLRLQLKTLQDRKSKSFNTINSAQCGSFQYPSTLGLTCETSSLAGTVICSVERYFLIYLGKKTVST